MKVKTDFVTNSSSTCYVVYLNPDCEIKGEELEKYIDEWYLKANANLTNDAIVDDAKHILDRIKNGETIWDEDEAVPGSYETAKGFIFDNGFVFLSFESTSNEGKMIALPRDKMEECFMKIYGKDIRGLLESIT